MSMPPAVPPVPDSDRYWSATLGITPIPSAAVPFPIYGDGSDIDVLFNGVALAPSFWSFVSASAPGAPLDSLPRPITDGQILFSPPVYGGLLEIIGDAHPRQTSMPSAPGIARREFNQSIGDIKSTLREFWRALKSQKAGVISFNATGPLVSRAMYDTASPPFLFLQTDDAQSRPVYYAKLSTNTADWSGPLVAVGPAGAAGSNGVNGTNGVNGAYAAGDPIVGVVQPTDYVPIQSAGVSKRVLRDTLLNAVSPDKRVAQLWVGEGQGSLGVGVGGAPLVIMADGTARSWGVGTDNVSGDTAASARYIPKTLQVSAANAVQPTLPWVQAARAGSSIYLLDSAGLVFVMGGNATGQLGLGDTVTRNQLCLLSAFRTMGIQVSSIITQPGAFDYSFGSTVYFLTTTGTLYAAGANLSGQIGDGTTTNRLSPVRCGLLTNVTKVQAAVDYQRNNFVMALDNAGNLSAWGDNTYGQLGDGSTSNRSSPYLTLTTVADFAIAEAGSNTPTRGGHAIAVRTNGTVYSVGLNARGQLGLGDTTNRTSWTPVAGITTALKAYTGGGYFGITLVLLSDGTIRIWGCNANAFASNQLTPLNPTGAFQGKVTSVHIFGYWVASALAVALVCSDGTVWGYGNNANGALGQTNGFANATAFGLITLPPGVTSPAVAAKFSGAPSVDSALFILLADGSLWSTGSNSDGRLGTQVGNLHAADGLERVIFT